MQISLFTCTCERNRINKTGFLTNRFSLDGAFRASTSGLHIEVLIEKTNPLFYNYNYMYIEEFKRYYFIDDIESIRTNLWKIIATTDVLMSFKNDILSSSAIVNKIENEVAANLYLDDGSFVMDSRKYNEIKEFPNGFNENGEYILICAGGV